MGSRVRTACAPAALLFALIPSLAAAQGGFFKRAPEEELRGPLRFRPRNFMDAWALIPEMETPRALAPGRWRLRVGSDFTKGSVRELDDSVFVDYDATRHDDFLELSLGFVGDFDLSLRVGTGELVGERNDEIVVFKGATQLLDTEERDFGFSDVVLKGKWAIMERGPPSGRASTAIVAAVRFPVSKQRNLLTTDAIDFSVSAQANYTAAAINVFGMVGYTLTGQESVFESSVDTDNIFAFGVGVNGRISEGVSLVAQIQGNTPLFSELDPVANPAFTLTAGVLADLGGPVLQAYVGTGLTQPRSDVVAGLQLIFFFGK